MKSKEKVIIIGNSPSILLQEYGELIDSYDVVIRINRCITKGFEKYIGQKIDIWATSHGYMMDNFVPLKYGDIRYLWKRTPKVKLNLDNCPTCGHGRDFSKVINHVMYKTKDYNKHFKKYIRTRFKLKHEPCTGLLTILTSLKFYKDVTIHGFTFYTEHEKHTVEGYYRESEVDEDGKHPEDKFWNKQIKTGFGSEDEGRKKQKILKELTTKGFSTEGSEDEGISTEPIKILNEDELGEMNL